MSRRDWQSPLRSILEMLIGPLADYSELNSNALLAKLP